MSTDIIFDKLSIQLSADVYMTLALMGNSRCFEGRLGRGRLARDWRVLEPFCAGLPDKSRPWATLSEFERTFDKEVNHTKSRLSGDEAFDPKTWGMRFGVKLSNGPLSFGQYKGLWINAAKKSITLSKLSRIFHGNWLELVVRENPANGVTYKRVRPRTGVEFMRLYQELQRHAGNVNGVVIDVGFNDEIAADVRRVIYKPKMIKERFNVEHYYTIMANGNFFAKLGRGRSGFYHAPWPHLKYENKKQANTKLKALLKRRPEVNFGVEKVNEAAELFRMVRA